MKQPIKLYGYATSPFVMKVAIYLEYKEIPFDFVHVRPRSNEQIAFTNQTQVPVLKIGDEWRKDSSELGKWIDELYPEKPLLGKDEAEKTRILAIDDWISMSLIPGRFRQAVDWTNSFDAIKTGWRLAQIVHHATPIPLHWRWLWPWAVRKAPFIRSMVAPLDRREPVDAMRARHIDEFEEHLAGGPYLGGLSVPSLADLSAFPIIVSGWLMGLSGDYSWMQRDDLLEWIERVSSHLPDNPLPVDDKFIVRDYPF